jgi:hypothetical protein
LTTTRSSDAVVALGVERLVDDAVLGAADAADDDVAVDLVALDPRERGHERRSSRSAPCREPILNVVHRLGLDVALRPTGGQQEPATLGATRGVLERTGELFVREPSVKEVVRHG